MENLNRVLLENVLPAHVAEHFLARNWKNEVREDGAGMTLQRPPFLNTALASNTTENVAVRYGYLHIMCLYNFDAFVFSGFVSSVI